VGGVDNLRPVPGVQRLPWARSRQRAPSAAAAHGRAHSRPVPGRCAWWQGQQSHTRSM